MRGWWAHGQVSNEMAYPTSLRDASDPVHDNQGGTDADQARQHRLCARTVKHVDGAIMDRGAHFFRDIFQRTSRQIGVRDKGVKK